MRPVAERCKQMLSRVANNEAWLTRSVELFNKAERENGEFARAIRQQQNVSLRELAKAMGVSAVLLSHLERGLRHWTPSNLQKWKAAITR